VDGLWDDVHKCYAKHVACAECEKILQIFARPRFVDHEVATEQISASGYQA